MVSEMKKKKPTQAKLEELSNKFYQTIPHAFGFSRPPVLGSLDAINSKVHTSARKRCVWTVLRTTFATIHFRGRVFTL